MYFVRIRRRVAERVAPFLKKLFTFPWNVLAVALLVLVIVGLRIYVFPLLLHRWLGDGPTLHGGSIGRRVDNSLKRLLFYYRDYQYRREFYQIMGYAVPSCPEPHANRKGVPVLLSTFYTESLRRAKKRAELHHLIQQQPQICSFSATEISTLQKSGKLCIFQPLLGDWFQPLPLDERTASTVELVPAQSVSNSSTYTSNVLVIPFLESEMDQWMLQQCSDDGRNDGMNAALWDVYQSFLTIHDRVQFWGLAMIFVYGGSFVGNAIRFDHDILDALFSHRHQPHNNKSNNNKPRLVWIRDEPDSNGLSYAYASDARPLELRCLFQYLIKQRDYDDVPVTFAGVLKYLENAVVCDAGDDEEQVTQCCENKEHAFLSSSAANEAAEGDNRRDQKTNARTSSLHQEVVTVVATDTSNRDRPSHRQPKLSHAQQMKHNHCTPGWFCNRCLKMPWRGSLSRCRHFCHTCYIDHISQDYSRSLGTIDVQVHVRTPPETQSVNGKDQRRRQRRRIPRIIHQTWFEELSVENYPHLSRLQNSWKASGWDYRFYTDQTAREYIQQHFPKYFVDAYDAVLPGAFKADFFRVLVLMKEGGIYADIDVQLDITNLDSFVTSNLSFFVPRDVPLDRWPHSNFCLWNGLMASAPAHPIVVQAAQDLLNHIQNRWDYYDVENALCSETLDCEIWKLRSIPVLLLTGPCALGISVNTALGHSNKVQGFELGWLPHNRSITTTKSWSSSPSSGVAYGDYGDGLILLTDRYDLGQLRFSDVDRVLLVASTDADKMITSPLKTTSQRNGAHYSKSEKDIMGSSEVYVDNLVTNEFVQLTTTIHHHT